MILSRYPNIDVQVYEAAGSFKEIGAGVMIWGRTWKILSLLGMGIALRQVAGVRTDGSEGGKYMNVMLFFSLLTAFLLL